MIYVNVILTAKNAADVEKVRDLLKQQGQLSRGEPGCVRFEVYQSANDAKVFILNEWWTDQEALDVHRKAHAFTTIYQPQVLPLVDRMPHPGTLVV
jgi:quinol monooxygenase YgiN